METKINILPKHIRKFGNSEILWREAASKKEFKATYTDVLEREMELNRILVIRGYAYLNEFLEMFDLKPIVKLDCLGWNWEGFEYYGYQIIDFSYWNVDDRVIEIDYPFPPHNIIIGEDYSVWYNTSLQTFQSNNYYFDEGRCHVLQS